MNHFRRSSFLMFLKTAMTCKGKKQCSARIKQVLGFSDCKILTQDTYEHTRRCHTTTFRLHNSTTDWP